MDGCRVFVYESDPNHWYSSSKESFKFQIFTEAYGCRPRNMSTGPQRLWIESFFAST